MASFFNRLFGRGGSTSTAAPTFDPALRAVAEPLYPVLGSIVDGSKARKAAITALVEGHTGQVQLNVSRMMSSFEQAKKLHEAHPAQRSGYGSPYLADIDRALDQCIAKYMEAAATTKRGIEAENEDMILSSQPIAKEAERLGDEVYEYMRKMGFPNAG